MTFEPTRRDFHRGSFALASSAFLPPLQDEPLRLGVIGIGIRGRNMMRGYFLKEDFRVTAVCDVDTNRMEAGKQQVDQAQGDQACFATRYHEEVLARDDVDAVVIATPDHWHTHQILDACKAGKHVYCEKPLTLNLHESAVVIPAVRKAGIAFQTGSQQRSEYSHRFVTACELVRNGRIGQVMTVNVGVGDPSRACDLPAEDPEPGLDWDRWLGPAPMRPYNSVLSPRGVHDHYPRFRDYWEYAGGGLADMGAHHFDIAQWGLRRDGDGPVEVHPPRDPSARRGASVVYADGVRMTHGGPGGTTFVGTGGLIHVDRGRLASVPGNLLEDPLPEDAERLPRRSNHAADWLRVVREGGETMCPVEVGAGTAAICHLLNLAYRHRRPLRWDPAAWRFVDDAEADSWREFERREGYALPT